MLHETRGSRPPTETPPGLRPKARLTTGLGSPIRRQPCVPGAVAAAAHDRRDCPAAPCRRPPGTRRARCPHVRVPVRPRAARCHAGGALGAAPATAGAASACGPHGPRPPTPGAPTNKPSLQADKRDPSRGAPARTTDREPPAARALRRVQCVEAAGLNLTMTRLYGRAPKGARRVGSLPLNSGAHITRLGALGVDGLQAVMSGEGATDAAVFRSYGQQGLGPTLARGNIVVLDNLAAHKTPGVQQALARRRWSGVGARSRPPCERPRLARERPLSR